MDYQAINTPHLILRPSTAETYDWLFASQSDTAIMDYLDLKTADDLEVEREKHKLGLVTHNRKFVMFHILEKETLRHLGACALHSWFPLHQRAEVGYHITQPADMNKGIMTEALSHVLHFGFTQMNLNRIEACLSEANIPSMKLLLNAGFKREGLLRQHYNTGTEILDSVVMSLLKKEFLLI